MNLIRTDAKKHERSVADIIYLTETIRNVSEQHLNTILKKENYEIKDNILSIHIKQAGWTDREYNKL